MILQSITPDTVKIFRSQYDYFGDTVKSLVVDLFYYLKAFSGSRFRQTRQIL